MIRLGTLRELFTYFDWGNTKVLDLAAGLSDDQFDRPFEMGEGSLRATLYHVWGSQQMWLDRWLGRPHVSGGGPAGVSIDDLRKRYAAVAAERAALIAQHNDNSLQRTITYTNNKGETYTRKFADMLMQVANHGIHHRAQALNMLRRLGVELPKPGVDYILMRLWETSLPAPQLDIGSLQTYHAYSDWATEQVLAAASGLSDAQLDREFEIGGGSLRDTLAHVGDAERWWLGNWRDGAGQTFPASPADIPVAQVRRTFADTARQRNEFVGKLADADLARTVGAQPRPGMTVSFPLGVTILQLCCHGTHHRAQALNMLRHVGGPVPGLDYVVYLREMQK